VDLEKQQKIIARIKKDPEYFIFNFCKTEDPHDEEEPIKLFPRRQHIRDMIFEIHNNDKVIITKSRQMQFTWTMLAYILWLVITQGSRKCYVQSKKEKDSDRLLNRLFGMWKRLPPFLQAMVVLRKKYCLVYGVNGSEVLGIQQDPEAYRQECASLVFVDEAEFQYEMERIVTSLMPTIHGGGKIVIGSSVNGNRNYVVKLIEGEV